MVSLEYQPDQVTAGGIDNTIGDGRVEGCEVVIMRLNGIAWRASFVVSRATRDLGVNPAVSH